MSFTAEPTDPLASPAVILGVSMRLGFSRRRSASKSSVWMVPGQWRTV